MLCEEKMLLITLVEENSAPRAPKAPAPKTPKAQAPKTAAKPKAPKLPKAPVNEYLWAYAKTEETRENVITKLMGLDDEGLDGQSEMETVTGDTFYERVMGLSEKRICTGMRKDVCGNRETYRILWGFFKYGHVEQNANLVRKVDDTGEYKDWFEYVARTGSTYLLNYLATKVNRKTNWAEWGRTNGLWVSTAIRGYGLSRERVSRVYGSSDEQFENAFYYFVWMMTTPGLVCEDTRINVHVELIMKEAVVEKSMAEEDYIFRAVCSFYRKSDKGFKEMFDDVLHDAVYKAIGHVGEDSVRKLRNAYESGETEPKPESESETEPEVTPLYAEMKSLYADWMIRSLSYVQALYRADDVRKDNVPMEVYEATRRDTKGLYKKVFFGNVSMCRRVGWPIRVKTWMDVVEAMDHSIPGRWEPANCYFSYNTDHYYDVLSAFYNGHGLDGRRGVEGKK